VARRKLIHEGTLVLDSEGLSKLPADDEQVVARTAEARSRGMEAVISALTIVEAVLSPREGRATQLLRPGTRPSRSSFIGNGFVVFSSWRWIAVGTYDRVGSSSS